MPSGSYVYFALYGDNFDPAIDTRELGIKPTNYWMKGDKEQSLANQKYSCWKWANEPGKEAIFLDKLVDEVIEKLNDKIEIINKLKNDYQLESVIEIVMYIDTNPEES